MTYKNLFSFLIILYCSIVASQNETNNWYFGDEAGLNFANASLTVLSNGAMNTPAGCATISDAQGNLMFYTNGNSVWNRNHELMSNGTNLAGDINSTQNSIIIPKPKDPNTYYIFTTRENPTSSAPLLTGGLFYSEVNFSNKNPLGIVSIKNRRLTPSATERITAIHHTASNTIRVIAFGKSQGLPEQPRDTFFIFNVSETGVMLPGITSVQKTTLAAAGAMKISPNGKYVAIADYSDRYIYVYDFDNDAVSFNLKVTLSPDGFFTPINPYGLEFSQNSKNLYFTGKNAPQTSYLKKYNLENTAILNEIYIVATSTQYEFGSLQLARDGNIYMASYDQLNPLLPLNQIGVITDAENPGEESGFQSLAIAINPGASYKGLPNFIQSYFNNRIIAENACVDVPMDFSLEAYAPIASVLWEFGDGTTSALLSPSHSYNVAGRYRVKATIILNGSPSELYKEVEAYALPSLDANQKLMQCDLDNDGFSFFNLYTIDEKMNNPNPDNELFFYTSYSEAVSGANFITNPEVFENVINPQELFVKIISPEGCETISNFIIETTFIELSGINDMYSCENSDKISENGKGVFDLSPNNAKQNEIRAQFNIDNTSTLAFYGSFQDAQTRINPLLPLHISATSIIWVRVDNPKSGCNGIGTIRLFVNPTLPLNIIETYTICDPSLQSTIVLDGNITNDRWEWKDNKGNILSTNRTFELNETGNFAVTVYKTQKGIECSRTEQFVVKGITAPKFNEVSAGDYEIFASVNGESLYQFSLDNTYYYGQSTSYTFFNVQPGIYTIYARDVNDCEPSIQTEVSFIGFSKYFTPNDDGFNDIWKIQGISTEFYNLAQIEIYDRYGKLLHTMDLESNDKGWNGTFNGELLKSTDYWFTATLIDLENQTSIKSGHFSLIL